MSDLLADLTENINTGIFKDPANDRVPLWSDGKNIVFDPEGPRPVDGFSQLVLSKPTSLAVRGMLQARIEGKKYIFFGTEKNLYRYDDDAGNILEVSKATDVYSGAFWSFAQWGNWVLATNNVDAVQLYKESVGNFADLTHDLGGTLTSVLVATFKAYAILLGTDSEGREVKWSDEDDVNVYSPTLANAAGSLYIRDLASPIIASAQREDGVIFYGDSTIHLLRWTGPPYYFGQNILSQNAGAIGKHAVVNVRNTHFGLDAKGIWAMEPRSEPQYIDKPQIHNYVMDDLDFDNAEKSVVWYDQQQDLLMVSYPSKEDGLGEPSRSVGLSLKTGGWSPMDFAATAAATSPVLQYTSAGDYLGGVYWHGVPGAGGGLPFDSQAFISMADGMTFHNYYGLGPYGKFDYGGPA